MGFKVFCPVKPNLKMIFIETYKRYLKHFNYVLYTTKGNKFKNVYALHTLLGTLIQSHWNQASKFLKNADKFPY